MNPLRIQAQNYRTFERLDLDLPAGCVAVIGENGAGKSSLVNVIDLALFGPDGRSWGPYLTQGVEGTRLELELTFEHGGAIYRARRGWSSAGKGKATLDLERRDPDHHSRPDRPDVPVLTYENWTPLTRESIDATQALLEETIGLTRETFRASSMLVQGDGAAFTEAQPRDRKRILAKILGLDRYERLSDLVRRDTRTAEREIDRLLGGLERAEQELAQREGVERSLQVLEEIAAAAEKDLRDAQTSYEAFAETVRRADEARRRRSEALARVMEISARVQPAETRETIALEAQRTLGVVRDEMAALTTPEQKALLERQRAELEQALEGYRHAMQRRAELVALHEQRILERNRLLGEASEFIEKALAKRELAEAYDGTPHGATCDRCGQTLGEEARASAIASLRTEADEFDAAAKDLDARAAGVEIPQVPPTPALPPDAAALDSVRDRIRKADADLLQYARLEERARQLDAAIAARPDHEELQALWVERREAEAAAGAIPTVSDADFNQAKAEELRARARVDEERERLHRAREEAIRDRTRLEQIEKIEAATRSDRDDLEGQRRRVDLLKILERAYGRDGIPALIIGQAAIPSIEVEAGRILAELGTSYRVELRTERALASGAVADALDVVVVTETGERPYETFSGGERTRLNLALRIALARLLAGRRGAESRILAIDEPEYLDTAGTAALVNVLRGLTGDFERIYLISHVPDLRTAFDSTIEVTKRPDGLSTIGGS